MKKALFMLCLVAALVVFIGAGRDNVLLPGKQETHTLLPNGWRLTPAGQHVPVGDLPLKMLLTPNRKYVLVATNGYNDQGVALLDVATGRLVSHVPLHQSYAGMDVVATGATGAAVYIAGARSGKVFVIRYSVNRLMLEDTLTVPNFDAMPAGGYLTGLALAPSRRLLLVVNAGQDQLHFYDLKSGSFTNAVKTGYHPYAVVVDKAGAYAYLSNWGRASAA